MVRPEDAGLRFVALGGSDEIGMNLYLYGLDGHWLMVDCGVAFGDETTPGIDVQMPVIDFIAERRDALLGIVLTHGHEDHLGAVQHLWPDLDCPVYASPFTAAFLRLKLRDTGLERQVPIHEVPVGGRIELGPFAIRYVEVAHSIPESQSLAITTRHGTVVHTGDWRIDPAPVLGPRTDEAAFREIGDGGVLAVVSDSTNALEEGFTPSEASAEAALAEVIASQPNRVAVTCFATNLGRVLSIARAARAADREVALVGRSLWRVREAALKSGHVDAGESFLGEDEAAWLPRNKVVLICTGSQGEPRAALSRIAFNAHPNIVLEAGDTAIYSAREIPGNEKAIQRVHNGLARQGVRVITADDAPVHVSGHPAQGEIASLYQWLRPQLVIPVHGDRRRQEAQAELARAGQVPMALIPEDGDMIALAPGRPRVVGQVPVGRLGLDGNRIIRLDDGTLRQRQRLGFGGAVTLTLVLDRAGRPLAEPQVVTFGIADAEVAEEIAARVAEEVEAVLADLPRPRLKDDGEVAEIARQVARRTLRSLTGKKPMVEVRVVRV